MGVVVHDRNAANSRPGLETTSHSTEFGDPGSRLLRIVSELGEQNDRPGCIESKMHTRAGHADVDHRVFALEPEPNLADSVGDVLQLPARRRALAVGDDICPLG